MWGTSEKLEEATGHSFDENASVFDPGEVEYHIDGVDGKGSLVEPSSGIVHAAWKCGSSKRGIVVKILYDSQKEHPRNLTEDAINLVKLIHPWACGLLGVFRTVLVLCFRLPSLSPGNRFQPRRECDTLGLSEDEYDCISARSTRQYRSLPCPSLGIPFGGLSHS